ncbi:winged helix-turn-helix domain-containing protein [Ornithinimicrobium cavernae]|uniref:winged helix-turn-helix domain-containing protein n=1 Tax=Ornithinimicrobium cavernae TaxID=2666047 RepID=UPI000D68D715|nr:winged helix-turn-helix domain-containing protein [Ornithinimicrobium cavernae]
MTQVVASEPVREPDEAPRPAALVVLVAPTAEERSALLAQLDPGAAVLIVTSLEMAQDLMGPAQPRGVAPAERGQVGDRQPGQGVRIHEDRRTVGFGTVEVTLTPLEFALLRRLIAEPGRVWRFDELVREVWGTDHLGDASQVHAVVKRLRAKLARERAPVIIEAVRGVGFRAVRPRTRCS